MVVEWHYGGVDDVRKLQLVDLQITGIATVEYPDNPLAKILLFKRRQAPVTKAAIVAAVNDRVQELRGEFPCTPECVLEARVWDANPELITAYNDARF